MDAPAELIEALHHWKRFVCVGHVTPDADCLGAILTVARVWSSGAARQVSAAVPPGSVSQRLLFMLDLAQVTPADAEHFAAAEGMFVADTARKSRCSLPPGLDGEWSAGRPVLNVDHHPSNTRFGDVNWIVDRATSSCELVYYMIKQSGLVLDAASASLLYAGIFGDTVGFSLPSTSGSALRAAADLVDRGADVAMLGERLTRAQNVSNFRLLKTIYANTHLTPDKQIAYSTADYREITEAGCTGADIDDQVQVPRSLADIRIAILFTEGRPGRTRINFRGERGTRVLELAARFDGGGHVEAAGAMLSCGIQEAVARVIPVAVEAIRLQEDGGQ